MNIDRVELEGGPPEPADLARKKNEANDPERPKPVEEQAGVSSSGSLGSAEEQQAPASADSDDDAALQAQDESADTDDARDEVATAKAGIGDEIKPQDFQNETDALVITPPPKRMARARTTRPSTMRKGAARKASPAKRTSRKSGARGMAKRATAKTTKGKRASKQSGATKAGARSRSGSAKR